MTDRDATLAHRNLLEYARWSTTLEPGTPVLDDDGILAFAFRSDWPATRLAIRADETLPAESWVARADDFLRDHGETACVFLREGIDDDLADPLRARGYFEHEGSPSMLCDAVPADRAPAEGVTVRLAESADDVRAYAEVVGRAFADLGFLAEPTREQVDNPAVLLADDVALAVAELDGRIVAGAFAVLVAGGTSAYVSYVAALAQVRGRALGDAVTRTVTREAFARGAASVSLEASKYGANTYRRMGYRDLFRYQLMIRVSES